MGVLRSKRVMITAPCSGSGKTLVTCGLLELLKSRGLEPVSFKCGPDYIDPMFHRKVLGIESRNLDTFFAGADGIRSAVAACEDRYAVIEGVMGLYDGTGPESTEGSAYEIASLLDAPIILVVDASGVGRTVISSVKGLLLDDERHLIKGIILNRISESFYERLRPVMEKELSAMREDVELLGFVPRRRDLEIGSRHLGLMLPGEVEDLREKITSTAVLLEENVDIPRVLTVMESVSLAELSGDTDEDGGQKAELPCPEIITETSENDLTLAVARDDAFCFYYPDNLELFRKLGVGIRFFSPLSDSAVPKGCDGILLGGGYPEKHLDELSGNKSMLESVRNALGSGIPGLAECGGFMYLHRSIEDMEGSPYEMAGVLDGDCSYTGHLVRFGYMEISAACGAEDELSKSLVGMRGHEFHYYESTCSGNAFVAVKPDRGRKWECMVREGNGFYGFPHFYYPSDPEFIRRFINRMREVKYG